MLVRNMGSKEIQIVEFSNYSVTQQLLNFYTLLDTNENKKLSRIGEYL